MSDAIRKGEEIHRLIEQAITLETERCAKIADAVAARFNGGYVPAEDVRGIARRIRGEHAEWCGRKLYRRDPCNCGIE